MVPVVDVHNGEKGKKKKEGNLLYYRLIIQQALPAVPRLFFLLINNRHFSDIGFKNRCCYKSYRPFLYNFLFCLL
jgi:hypothetical protein